MIALGFEMGCRWICCLSTLIDFGFSFAVVALRLLCFFVFLLLVGSLTCALVECLICDNVIVLVIYVILWY